MSNPENLPRGESGVIQHLEAALEMEEMNESNYHVRQALQLLDVEQPVRTSR